jgi:hypothetical protein
MSESGQNAETTKSMEAVMKRIGILGSGVLLVAMAAPAQVARVFVSINGNDANTCSNVATPCRTFNGGITQVDPGGEVIVLDTGSYGGTPIAKAVTINVPPGVVAFAAQPFTINGGVNDVIVLRGLTIKALTPGSGVGITFNSGKALHLENCVINGWATGLSFGNAGQLFVKDSFFRNHTTAGVAVSAGSGTAFASLDGVRFEGNFDGLLVGAGGRATIRGSVASGNSDAGLLAIPSSGTASLNVESCLVANNPGVGIEGAGAGAGTVRVSNSIVTDNGTGLSQGGSATVVSRTNNTVEGNTPNTAGAIGTYLAK